MAHDRLILPSNYPPSQQLPEVGRSRQPLTDSSGNSQYSTLAFNDYKGHTHVDHAPPRFSLPTLPSQPAQPALATALELRRAQTRRDRQRRGRNPIYESSQYQQYRARQQKDTVDDQKWPDHLEDAFLEALIEIPHMGRRKFSVDGKPHGRNELIAKYLAIAYRESLSPSAPYDKTQERTRKQVSSHIQVLKGFMRGHPSYDRLFPPKDAKPANGFEDSFKNDPFLRALAENRLPHKRYSHPDRIRHAQPIRPSHFDMYMTVLRPGYDFKDIKEDHEGEGKFTERVHTYAGSPLRPLPRDSLESLSNWRGRFPLLAQAQSGGDLKCDIIHIDASLALRNGKSPDKAELWGRFEVIIPGVEDPRATWRCEHSFYKPEELYGPPDRDPRYESMNVFLSPSRYEPGIGTYMRVTFAANPWAHALGKLADLHEEFEQAARDGGPYTNRLSARQYIDQISIYQELFCKTGPAEPWVKKVVIAWTFRKARPGEKGETSWRYLDATPPRQVCFEPGPGRAQVASAMMAENYHNAWNPGPQLQLQSNVPFDPLLHGLVTPPATAVLHSPFPSHHNTSYNFAGQGDLAGENLSFMSHDTADSDSTLVETQASAGLGNYMHSSGVGLGDYDPGVASHLWAPRGVENFASDHGFLGGYGGGGVATQVWDAEAAAKGWGNHAGFNGGFEEHLGARLK